jgi:hypothetical protein
MPEAAAAMQFFLDDFARAGHHDVRKCGFIRSSDPEGGFMSTEQWLSVFAFYSVLCGALGGFLAWVKNRALVEGLLLGLALGIIGLVIEGLLPAHSAAQSSRAAAASKVPCRECGRPWHPDILLDGVCAECRRRRLNLKLKTGRRQPE